MKNQMECEFEDKRCNSSLDYGEFYGTLVFW